MNHQVLLFFFVFSLFSNLSLSDPRATEAALVCTNRTASITNRQSFAANFLAAMNTFTPLIVRQRYGAVVNGSGDSKVYAFGECMKDLDQSDCNVCFAQCKAQIVRCLPFQSGTRGGRLFYDGCYLRYDDYNFFGESLSEGDRTVCATKDVVGSSNRTRFRANVMELVRNLSVESPKNDGFFVGSMGKEDNVTVYGLAQCWEVVNASACGSCLANAVSRVSSCLPKEEGRVLNAGCYLRYSTHKFYYNSTALPVAGNPRRRRLAIILATTFSAMALTLIIATAIFFVHKKLVKKREESKQLGALSPLLNKSKLSFSYESLEKATDYFNDSNKLGQGGSDLTPKIADFGLVRLFPEDKSHISTAIAGTLNKCFSPDLVCILHMVWNHYEAEKLREAVDPVIEYHFQEKASRLLQIGLLCVQASAEIRPSMSTIVQMLTDDTLEFPRPTQPPPFYSLSSRAVSQNVTTATSNSQPESYILSTGNSTPQSTTEPRWIAFSNRIHNDGLDRF
ncbi:hypothetical protein V6N13_124442 [Hibiscus sabdariffa]